MRLEIFNWLWTCPPFHLTCVISLSRTTKRTLGVKRRGCHVPQGFIRSNQFKWDDVLMVRVASNSEVKDHTFSLLAWGGPALLLHTPCVFVVELITKALAVNESQSLI